MSRQRSSVQKREREQKKRDRQMKKASKAADRAAQRAGQESPTDETKPASDPLPVDGTRPAE